jgi:hypothetical protein
VGTAGPKRHTPARGAGPRVRRRVLRRAPVALFAATLLAGCGTTVPLAGGTSEVGSLGEATTGSTTGSQSGLTPSAGGGTGTVGGAGGADASGSARSGASGDGGVAGTTGSAPSTPPPSGVQPLSGVGFDAKHVYIGVGTTDDAGSYASGAGINVNIGNPKAQAQALINDINRHGGLVGRQIVPIWHDVSTADYNTNPSSTAQAECTDWTQDNHVFAAVNILTYPENAVACLAQAHTVGVSTTPGGPVVTAMLRRYSPYFYAPGMADTEHLTPAFVDDLVRQNYFTPWDTANGKAGSAPVKIAVLYAADRPDLLTLSKQALARHNLTVTDSYEVQSASDDGQLAGVVLKFNTEGITHILTNGLLSFIPRVADTQNYRPRYGVSSWDSLQVAAGTAPARQFAGAVGIGWTPSVDVDAAHDPGPSVAGRQCLALMRAAGQDTSDRTTAAVMESSCEQFGLLRAALANAVGLGPTVLRDGVESLGDSFLSTLTFGERFTASRHAGVSAFRPVRFDSTGCSCFTYAGPVTKFN